MEFAMVVILIGVLTLLGGRANETALDAVGPPSEASAETLSAECGSPAGPERNLTLPYGEQVRGRREVACQPDWNND